MHRLTKTKLQPHVAYQHRHAALQTKPEFLQENEPKCAELPVWARPMLQFMECWWQLSIKLLNLKQYLLSYPRPQLIGSDIPARQCPTMQFNKLKTLLPHPPKEEGDDAVSVLQLSHRSINVFSSLSGMNKQVLEIKTFYFEPSFFVYFLCSKSFKGKRRQGWQQCTYP